MAEERHIDSAALKALDYIYPLSVATVFIGVTTFNACTLRSSRSPPKKPRGRSLALWLTLINVLSYVAQALLYLTRALMQKGWWAPEHTILNVLASILVWGITFVALLGSPIPTWGPYVGAWSSGFGLEIAICVLYVPLQQTASLFDLTRTGLQGLRIACLLILAAHGIRLLILTPKMGSDEECQPLLANDANGPATNSPAVYGSTTADQQVKIDGEEDEDEDKEIKEQQRKRLEAQGGWWGYMKGFTVFLPYIWPSDNMRIQFCVVLIAIDLIADRFLNVLTPRQIGIITDKLTSESSAGVMPWKEVFIWVFFRWIGSSAGLGIVKSIASTHVRNYSYSKIQDLAFKHVMKLSMDFHSNKDSGEVIRSVDQADSLNDLFENIAFQVGPLLIDVVVALGYVTHLFDVYIAFVVLVVGAVYVWMGAAFTARTQPKRRIYVERSRHENKTLYESVSNWNTVSYFNRIPHEQQRYRETVQSAVSAQLSYFYLSYFSYAAQSLVMTLGLLTASFLAVYQITSGQKPVGNFVTLVMYWGTMMSPLSTMAYSWRRISSTLVDAERLLQLIQTKASVQNAPGAMDMVVGKARVVFDGVDFSYDARKQTLKGMTFTAEPGQTIAFVGETGSGKSTTLKLLFRFYDVTGGSISIDGQDIREVTLDSLRDALGVVPQDPSLFNQTIMENVRYARLDASDDEVIDACRGAAVHNKIVSFPDGYKSKVGERGVKLSGGELQRIAIARVILKNPKIVLLDEATSAVDSSIEAQIQAAFKKLSAGRTTFVIAHRLSTIVDADVILVIDQGQIIERGTHEQLLAYGGKYLELWTKQTAGKSSKASSITAANSDDEFLHCESFGCSFKEEHLLDQVDGQCDSRPMSEVQGCFGKKSTNRNDSEYSDSDSEADGPIRMISAQATNATQASTTHPRAEAESQRQEGEGVPKSEAETQAVPSSATRNNTQPQESSSPRNTQAAQLSPDLPFGYSDNKNTTTLSPHAKSSSPSESTSESQADTESLCFDSAKATRRPTEASVDLRPGEGVSRYQTALE